MEKKNIKKTVETLTHEGNTRKNIPTVEYQSVMGRDEQSPIRVAYKNRNPDLDPQLIWRGKDIQDWSNLVVQAPPLYIQEKVHPKVLIDDLKRRTENQEPEDEYQIDLFEDFNGLPDQNAQTEFYKHDGNWTNRIILGDSLQVMASLSEREGLRGQVQCIYIDPPYGIKFNSNFQWSTTSRDVKDNVSHITREPEQVKAFRDTWRDGIHTYMTHLRDRLTAALDLLSDTGCVVLQMGDENVHRARVLLDEVFGESNFVSLITIKKTNHQHSNYIPSVSDYLIVYAKSKTHLKYRPIRSDKSLEGVDFSKYNKTMDSEYRVHPVPKEWKEKPELIPDNHVLIRTDITLTQDGESTNSQVPWNVFSDEFYPGKGRHWRTHEKGRQRLWYAGRVSKGKTRPFYIEPWDDKPAAPINNIWTKNLAGAQHKIYVVQTNVRIIEQILLTFSDPGDLILDPTCGAGTTAYVAEQQGRRWITIDTSRVALTLARTRIMGAIYPYYLLADSKEGHLKEAEIKRTVPKEVKVSNSIRHGFVYERLPYITLKAIANNAEIDVIWNEFQEVLEPIRKELNKLLGLNWEEWDVPRENDVDWPDNIKKLHTEWWNHRIARQNEINASIAAKADFENLYDKPYIDKKKVRVAGPFTVESLSPHRVMIVNEDDELIEGIAELKIENEEEQDFAQMILQNLETAGVQQAHKEDRINFSSVTPWPGEMVCAEGRYIEGNEDSAIEKRAAIMIGPEFGTVSRYDLVAAAREAGDADFDVLICCAFNYDAHSSEFHKLGKIPVLKARMNAELHMGDELKNNGKGNLFVIFGEPDIEIIESDNEEIKVQINGVDVFHPTTGEVRSDGAEGIACWFIDTDYNEESFIVRHAYFLGADDPYKSLKMTLKAEINNESWQTLHSNLSRPFKKPQSGRIAIKVINHLGDEVMKVFRIK